MDIRHHAGPCAYSLVATAGAAQNGNGIPVLTIQDYFIIFLIAIVYLMVFMAVAERILRYQSAPSVKKRNLAIYAIGNIIGFMFIAAGNLLIISSVMIVIAFAMQVEMLAWVVEVFAMHLISPVVEIALISGGGLVFYLVGIYIVIHMQGNPFIDRRGTPTRAMNSSKYSIDQMDEEPLNPTITFRVLDKDTDEPAVDAKVILKQMNGTRFYEKYTDFNGEVTFQKIDGYGSEYYAYVEGDERRERYRVIRRTVSAEI
ncbi:MAG: hypothetical protein QHG99_00445 [Methanomicrobiales archaeon]|nr:hypothetical protein [Methanomicrobiales archaeon]